MPLQYCKYHFSSQNILSYSMNNAPQTPQTLKTEERMQMWDRKLHRLKIPHRARTVEYIPCWGEGQTSALSMKTKAATVTSIKRPSFSFKKKKPLQARKAGLPPRDLIETQNTSKTLCTHQRAVSMHPLRMRSL